MNHIPLCVSHPLLPDERAPCGLRTVGAAALLLAATAALLDAVLGYHGGFATLNAWGAHLPAGGLQCLTYVGDSLFALALLLPLARRCPQLIWTAVVAALIALALSHGLKLLVNSPRPAAVLHATQLFVEGPVYRRNSFPSGHSVTAFVLAASLALHLPGLWGRLLVLTGAGLVALSRVLVGVHWPVDVAAGAALGCVSALLGARLAMRWDWGLRRRGHRWLVGLLSASAAALLLVPVPYPHAEHMARGVALLALLVTLWNYLLAPRLAARRANRSGAWRYALRR